MQEYLAAFHLSTLLDAPQLLLMEESFWDGRFNFVWMMFAGIVGMDASNLVIFISKKKETHQYPCDKLDVSKIDVTKSISQDIINDKRKCLHLFQCYSEAKSDRIPKTVSSLFSGGNIDLTGIALLPHHVSSLIFFMSASKSEQWTILNLALEILE